MAAPKLRAEHTPESLRIFREGLATPLITQQAKRDKRPYIHPILAPDGVGELTENEPGHHLWQHGLYVGLNDVNGVGFWTEGLHEKSREKDGSFHPLTFDGAKPSGSEASWQLVTEWRSPKGEPMLWETQEWTFTDNFAASSHLLTLKWTLSAKIDLTFGKYPYGGLFLRMPYRGEGIAFNSERKTNKDAEGQRAEWVCVRMPIPGREKEKQRECAIALFDHPKNAEHPAPWRVDGQLGIAPSRCIAGAWTLAKGESVRSCYGVFSFIASSDVCDQSLVRDLYSTFCHWNPST